LELQWTAHIADQRKFIDPDIATESKPGENPSAEKEYFAVTSAIGVVGCLHRKPLSRTARATKWWIFLL